METKLDKKLEKYDDHTQLYLRVYEAQDRRHQRFRYLYRALAILAAFVPPVSLLFTVQATLMDMKKEGFSPWASIGLCLCFAIVPIASGFMSWNIIDKFEQERRGSDNIQKETYSKNDLSHHKKYLTQVKNQMRDLGINVKDGAPESSRKKKKVKIERTEVKPKLSSDGEVVEVYMDAAQIERDRMLLECGIYLIDIKENRHVEQSKAKILGVSDFFQTKHAESVKLVESLEAQYKL